MSGRNRIDHRIDDHLLILERPENGDLGLWLAWLADAVPGNFRIVHVVVQTPCSQHPLPGTKQGLNHVWNILMSG